MTDQRIASHEYKNDYFYLVFRETPERGPKTFVFCSGINMTRFDPICWGKAGICSNPAFKGLQLLRAEVSTFARKMGKPTKAAEDFPCGSITPPVSTGWFRETPLFIEQATLADIRKIMTFSVPVLVKFVLTVCSPETKLPAKVPTPPAMQKFLNELNVKNYREAAPSPISKPNGSKSDGRDH